MILESAFRSFWFWLWGFGLWSLDLGLTISANICWKIITLSREKHICDFPLKLDTWYWWFESKNILKDVVVVLKPESVNRNWMSDRNLETAKLISLHVHATNLRDKIYFSHLREPRSWWRVVNVFSVFTNCLGSVSVPRAPVTVTTRRQETFSGIFIIAFCSQI